MANDARSYPVLKAVAYPPTLLFVPPEAAALNIAANVVVMLVFLVLFKTSPMPFLVTIAIGHAVLAFLYLKDAHMTTLAKAVGGRKRRSRNIVRASGVKFVP